MIEIGGEWGEFQHYMQRRGSPRREDSTVCTVCMGGGLVNGKCEHYGAFHTRPQTTGRPAFQGRSFCCVCPSGAWKPYPKVTSSQMPYHLSQPLSVSTTLIIFNSWMYCTPLLFGHHLCPCDLPRRSAPWWRRPGHPLIFIVILFLPWLSAQNDVLATRH